jgi:uncharacterized protein (TIGR02147 family)
MSPKQSKPDIFAYLDVCLFLQDMYSYRKLANAGFSYESWARSMDVKSRSYLRFAIYRKRKISEELAQKFIINLGLNQNEKDYFVFLILYSQAKNPEQKKIFGEKLTHFLRSNSLPVDVKPHLDILGNPLVIAVRNILTFPDVLKTPQALAHLLKTPEPEIYEALLKLRSQGLASCDGDTWTATQEFIQIASTPADQALLAYHRESLLKAIQSQNLSPDERSFRSVTLALSPDEYQNYLKELGVFVTQLFGKFKSDSLQSKRLYQINFNLFPWTFSSNTDNA